MTDLSKNIEALREKKAVIEMGGGEAAIEKQVAMGKLTARERILALLDKNSFHEYDMFVKHDGRDFGMEKKVLPGGGVALIRAKQAIIDLKGDNDEQNAGIRIVLRAMEEPLRQIVKNAGEEPSVVVNQVAQGEGNYGYNAQTGEYGNLVEMGHRHQRRQGGCRQGHHR